MARRRKMSFAISDEAKSRLRILAGQCRTTEDEVVEAAINVLYEVAPRDRNERTTLEALIRRVSEKNTKQKEAKND